MAKRPKHHQFIRYAGLGFEVLACILLFVGAGYWLDQKFETEKPYFTLVLALVGCGVAMYLMVRTINDISSRK